jgi:hypothetical protein
MAAVLGCAVWGVMKYLDRVSAANLAKAPVVHEPMNAREKSDPRTAAANPPPSAAVRSIPAPVIRRPVHVPTPSNPNRNPYPPAAHPVAPATVDWNREEAAPRVQETRPPEDDSERAVQDDLPPPESVDPVSFPERPPGMDPMQPADGQAPTDDPEQAVSPFEQQQQQQMQYQQLQQQQMQMQQQLQQQQQGEYPPNQ